MACNNTLLSTTLGMLKCWVWHTRHQSVPADDLNVYYLYGNVYTSLQFVYTFYTRVSAVFFIPQRTDVSCDEMQDTEKHW